MLGTCTFSIFSVGSDENEWTTIVASCGLGCLMAVCSWAACSALVGLHWYHVVWMFFVALCVFSWTRRLVQAGDAMWRKRSLSSVDLKKTLIGVPVLHLMISLQACISVALVWIPVRLPKQTNKDRVKKLFITGVAMPFLFKVVVYMVWLFSGHMVGVAGRFWDGALANNIISVSALCVCTNEDFMTFCFAAACSNVIEIVCNAFKAFLSFHGQEVLVYTNWMPAWCRQRVRKILTCDVVELATKLSDAATLGLMACAVEPCVVAIVHAAKIGHLSEQMWAETASKIAAFCAQEILTDVVQRACFKLAWGLPASRADALSWEMQSLLITAMLLQCGTYMMAVALITN